MNPFSCFVTVACPAFTNFGQVLVKTIYLILSSALSKDRGPKPRVIRMVGGRVSLTVVSSYACTIVSFLAKSLELMICSVLRSVFRDVTDARSWPVSISSIGDVGRVPRLKSLELMLGSSKGVAELLSLSSGWPNSAIAACSNIASSSRRCTWDKLTE